MGKDNKKIDIALGIGVLLCLYSLFSGFPLQQAANSPFSLFQEAMAGICSGTAGIVGGIIIVFRLSKMIASRKKQATNCPNCGSVPHNADDKFCYFCGEVIN